MKRSSSSLFKAHSRGSFGRLLFESEHCNGGGSADRSLTFRLSQLLVLVLRIITPISYIYLLSLLFIFSPSQVSWFVGGKLIYNIITFWMVVEATFLPYYCYLFTHLDKKRNKDLPHFANTREARQELVKNCFKALAVSAATNEDMPIEQHLYLRKVIEGWFLDVPISTIHYENVASWCSWAYFDKDMADLNPDEKLENYGFANYIERIAQWKFLPGHSNVVIAARLTLDPLFATQRPFFFYATIWLLNTTCHGILKLLGFKKRSEFDTVSQSIYYRSATTKKLNSTCSNEKKSEIFSKSQNFQNSTNSNIENLKSSQGLNLGNSETSGSVNKIQNERPIYPIVFIHGIGIGFTHYISLIWNLPTEVDVYLVEWPHVAMQMRSEVPTANEVVNTFINILDHDNHEKACFVGHSLGTTAVAWMLRHEKGLKRVASTVLLDPVTFLLCDPTVATVFVYKDPTKTIDFLMHYFLSRELFIANALSRHFSWSHNILFVEDLTENSKLQVHWQHSKIRTETEVNEIEVNESYGHFDFEDNPSEENQSNRRNSFKSVNTFINHTIISSSYDSIVPVKPVYRYFKAKLEEGHKSFEFIPFEGHHGEMMLHPTMVKLIKSKIRIHCGVDPRNKDM